MIEMLLAVLFLGHCHATMIGDDVALTSAHCVTSWMEEHLETWIPGEYDPLQSNWWDVALIKKSGEHWLPLSSETPEEVMLPRYVDGEISAQSGPVEARDSLTWKHWLDGPPGTSGAPLIADGHVVGVHKGSAGEFNLYVQLTDAVIARLYDGCEVLDCHIGQHVNVVPGLAHQ